MVSHLLKRSQQRQQLLLLGSDFPRVCLVTVTCFPFIYSFSFDPSLPIYLFSSLGIGGKKV